MEIFENFEKLASLDENHYVRTHPLSSKRIANIKTSIRQLEPQEYFFNEHLDYRYQRILAKVKAFSNKPEKTLREIDQSNTNEITLIKKAIASHLTPDPEAALEAIKRLIVMKPKDPYFIELLGQIYLETGNPKKAISAFSKALTIMPNEPSFLIWSAISHLALETNENNIVALELLKTASKSDEINPKLLRYLAIAYARNGQPGKAALTTSEYYIILGRFKAARMQANQALKTLKPYSYEWRKAQDIIKISSKLGENN
jgi:predicted Zn-dependent protease